MEQPILPENDSPPLRGTARKAELLNKFVTEISDPLHRRIVEAYRKEDPIRSMESELGSILLEVIDED